MKSNRYEPLNTPIRLHLEYENLTVGELSGILRQWQVVLRSAWRETYVRQSNAVDFTDPEGRFISFAAKESMYRGSTTARLLVVTTSTAHSFDILADFGLDRALLFSTAFLGPIVNWPSFVRVVYEYLRLIVEARLKRYGDSGKVLIKGVGSTELQIHSDMLKDSDTADRVERLWEIANSGNVRMSIDMLDEAAEPEDD